MIAVRLSGLRVIDLPSAFQLSHFRGYGIFLDGLAYIEPEVLGVLCRFSRCAFIEWFGVAV